MMVGVPDAAAIAADLSGPERDQLLRLSTGGWLQVPSVGISTLLLLHHGAPLIQVMGDWALLTRLGAKVAQHLVAGVEQ
jgi:hypothetical protein